MIIKINGKEYSFDGYANPINSVQKLAEDIYQQGRADERAKMLMPYDVESIDELIENVRAKMLEEVHYAFNNEWTLDSLACHDNKYEILTIIKIQIEQLKAHK